MQKAVQADGDRDLALIVARWPVLSPHAKATILGIVQRAAGKAAGTKGMKR